MDPGAELNTIELGSILQRLFSTFPNSWPGVGLLLLRLCLSLALLYFSIPGLSNSSEATVAAQKAIATVSGLCMLAGLWTPVMAAFVALDQVWMALSDHSADRLDTFLHLYVAVIAVSVALLGPGAWSIDARLFGRQRFDIDRTRGRR